MNPTNGSWWIVQIVSNGSDKIILREFALLDRSREDMNHPPTVPWVGFAQTLRVAFEVEKI